MENSEARKRTALLVVLPLLAALIAGLAVWAATGARVAAIEKERDEALEHVERLEREVELLIEGLGEEEPAEEGDSGDDSTAEPPASDGEDVATGTGGTPDGRYFCYVRDVKNETGTTEITVDFADFLTGDEAAAAAAAAGEESPPPNDYFISNVNPMLRTFPVQAGIDVRLHHTGSGVDTSGYTVVLGQWHDFFIGMTPNMEVLREVPYWIEVAGGTVTSIEEQYLP